MRRAIGDLEQFADKRLFEELSEGMPLIVDNAARLDDTAHRLHRDGEFRASEIMRGFAEEEAAKFLILIDYVRCPRNSEHRTQVLKRFYGHVAKRIHAMACSYPRIASFGELSELVESECRPWYLDGPNGVDWISPNSIAAEREQGLYVDYVPDITDTAGAYRWTTPDAPSPGLSQYATPDSVTLAQALSLAEIAHIWRQFVPQPDTDRDELQDSIIHTLDRLAHCGYAVDEPTVRLVVSHWPFPLWPLTVKEPRPPDGDLEGLRELRQRTIDWIEETEAQRDPAPAISRSKVEELNDAYAAWKRDADARPGNAAADEDTGLRIRWSADLAKDFELPSWARLQDMFRKRIVKERAALLALGWYARERVSDWPRIYARAVKQEPTTGERYQIGCACYWLDGLDRWEEKPQQFQADAGVGFHRRQ